MLLFDLSLSSKDLFVSFILVAVLLLAIIVFTRRLLKQKTQKLINNKPRKKRMKYPEVDVFRMSSTFFNLALMAALLLALLAFNWTTYEEDIFIPEGATELDSELEIMPRTQREKPKPPPPPPPPAIDITDDPIEDESLFEDISIESDEEITAAKETQLPPPPPPPPPPETDDTEPIIFAEKMPRFRGCEDVRDKEKREQCAQQEMLKFIYKNIKYPNIAKETGVEGTVVIRFVIEKDGSITDVHIVRDIGAGCGKEAMRVVKMMPKWIPGKQAGRPVRVLFTLPVKFQLER